MTRVDEFFTLDIALNHLTLKRDRKKKKWMKLQQKQYLFDNNSIICEGNSGNDRIQDASSDVSPVSSQNICLN